MDRQAFSRRELLRRGGGLWLAAGMPLGGTPGLASPAARTLTEPRAPLRKGMSMGGYSPLVVPDGHPNDYRLHGNREYVRDSDTTWVKLWVSWAHLQEELQPAARAESWAQLNAAPAGERALERLDRQLRAVNDDAAARPGGLGAIVCVYQDFPTWSSVPAFGDPARAGKPLNAKLPADLSPTGPWAWFIGHLCARYGPRGPRTGAPGPADAPNGPALGNPLGARADFIEIVNEPNYLLWPQAGIHERVAEMMRTATAISAELGGPGILAPATSDFPDFPHEAAGATDWRTFTSRLLEALPDFSPRVPTAWSAHNYLDVRDEVAREDSRARRTVELLRAFNWRGGGDRRLWLTEGGSNLFPSQYDPEARLAQARRVERSFFAMAGEPDVHLWTQHTIHDVYTNDFKSGLRDEFVPGLGPGTERPAWHAWRALPGAGRA
jgi:hypothetical protein